MLNKILNLCLAAKELGHDCYFDYSPHVNSLYVQIFEGGWKGKTHPDSNFVSEIDNNEELGEIISSLEKLIERASVKDIDFNKMEVKA